MRHKFRFLFILVPIAFISVATLATMGLWNWLMPSLFGFGTLTFLKALGIFALARLLLGGRGFGGWRHHRLAYAGYYNAHNREEWQQSYLHPHDRLPRQPRPSDRRGPRSV